MTIIQVVAICILGPIGLMQVLKIVRAVTRPDLCGVDLGEIIILAVCALAITVSFLGIN